MNVFDTAVSNRETISLRTRLVTAASRWIVLLCLLAGLVWSLDALSLHFQIPSRAPRASFQVRTMYGVKKKNGSTEYFFDDPQPQTCVNSLLPHQGFSPCWWVSRHTERRVDLCDGCSVTPTRSQ